MSNREIQKLVASDIKDRTTWADRQVIFYQMRHDGLRRRRKPFPGAADLHYPLIDQTIEKQKPFYFNQIFATEQIADFVGKPDAPREVVTSAAQWFDYKIKEVSNFEDEIIFSLDYMLESGRGPLKITWDAVNKRLRFEAIEATYFIVPKSTGDLAETDRATHVQHVSKFQYQHGRMSKVYAQGDDIIKRISGKISDADSAKLQEQKALREGITHCEDEDTIVLWEVYERIPDGWKVHTFSPAAPELEIRKPFTLPYQHGKLPFISLQLEKKARGYYDSRGLSEILAPFETSLCKMWNDKHDAMTYFNRPLLSSDQQIANTGNLQWEPGTILQFPVKRVDLGAPPMSFDQEMLSTREIAEQRVSTPDFGLGQRNSAAGGSEKATAREIDALVSVGSVVTDMKSRINRRQLAGAYLQAWELLKQYDTDFQYLKDGEFKQLPEKARDSIVSVSPAGSASSWNRQGQLQKAIGRKQLLGNSPHINQPELDKSILELDDPSLIKRLVIDPNLPAQEQASRQMLENAALMLGQPVPINPDDKDEIHADVLLKFKAHMGQLNAPVLPVIIQNIDAHLGMHMQRLQKTNPKAFGALVKQIKAMQQPAQQPQPEAQAA